MTYTFDRDAMRKAIDAAGGPAAVAARAQLSRTNVSYWARGMVVPTAENLAKLATALGVPPSRFFARG